MKIKIFDEDGNDSNSSKGDKVFRLKSCVLNDHNFYLNMDHLFISIF